jgi:hypothetical protein
MLTISVRRLNTRQEMGRNRAKPGDIMDLEMMRDPHGIQFFVGARSSSSGQLRHSLESHYRQNPGVIDIQCSPPVHINVEKTIELSG